MCVMFLSVELQPTLSGGASFGGPLPLSCFSRQFLTLVPQRGWSGACSAIDYISILPSQGSSQQVMTKDNYKTTNIATHSKLCKGPSSVKQRKKQGTSRG